MSCENIVFNIIIPIVSAIIGGGLTLVDVAPIIEFITNN